MELLNYLYVYNYYSVTFFFRHFILSFKDVFILFSIFSMLYFHLDIHCMCDTTHTHVYVCSGTLLCTNSKVVHVEFFCEVSFVFSDCRMFAGLQHLVWRFFCFSV